MENQEQKVQADSEKDIRKRLPKDAKALNNLSISKRMRAAEDIGDIVGRTVDKAVQKANKFLKKYGYMVSVTLNFHEIKKDQENQ